MVVGWFPINAHHHRELSRHLPRQGPNRDVVYPAQLYPDPICDLVWADTRRTKLFALHDWLQSFCCLGELFGGVVNENYLRRPWRKPVGKIGLLANLVLGYEEQEDLRPGHKSEAT